MQTVAGSVARPIGMRGAGVWTALALALVLAGVLAKPQGAFAAGGHVETYGLMFVCDGARGDVWYDYAVNGYQGRVIAPNVKKYFIDQGMWVHKATTIFPTITGAGMPAVLTGCFPGRHGLPSLYFFDRKTKQYPVLYVPLEAFTWDQFLSKDVKTIWEYFEGPNDAISFGPALHRGSDHHVNIAWNLEYTPMEIRGKMEVAFRELQRTAVGGLPARLSVVYNGWFDHMEHGKGARSAEMIDDYISVDRQIGEAMDAFLAMVDARRKAGATVRYYAVLASDHGHQDIRTVNSIDDFITKQQGAMVVDKIWDQIFGVKLKGSIPKDLSPYDMVCAAGEGHALLYFPTLKPQTGGGYAKVWEERPGLDLLRHYPYHGQIVDIVGLAVQQPAVGFITALDGITGRVHVYNRSGESTIERRYDGGRPLYAYRVVEGEDPLGFATFSATCALVGGAFHSSREWQLATLDTNYPDAVVMLLQVFDVRDRAADIFLSAAPYVSIGDLVDGAKSKSKHGGLTPEEAWATLAFHGTGLEPAIIPTARNVDAVPTLLTLMDKDYDADKVDGEPVPEVLARFRQTQMVQEGALAVATFEASVQAQVDALDHTSANGLAAWARTLSALLSRPGLPAARVTAWRQAAYSRLAARPEPEARRVLRGEVASEFLERPRPDLDVVASVTRSSPARPLSSEAAAALAGEAAQAAYTRVFELLEVQFELGTDPASAAGKAALAQVDAQLGALAALHDAGFPVPSPRLSYATWRNGTNLWLEGAGSAGPMDSASRDALARFIKTESSRADNPLKHLVFNGSRALIQVAIGRRLERLADRLARAPSRRGLDAGALARSLEPGKLRSLLGEIGAISGSSPGGVTGAGVAGAGSSGPGAQGGSLGSGVVGASGTPAMPVPAGSTSLTTGGSPVLDSLYRDLGAH